MEHSIYDPQAVSPSNIWTYRQNKPSYIVRDLRSYGVPDEVTYNILMARGVFKWLAVRRHLIRLKNDWKNKLTGLYGVLRSKKESHDDPLEIAYWRGYVAALEMCRADVRELCHSERWQAPDHDRDALRFLGGADVSD